MLKFQWNALRRGDPVFVHDDSEPDLGPRAGVITLIDVRPRGPDVGTRLTTGTPTAPIVRPGRFAVQLATMIDDDSWRCTDTGHHRPDTGVGPGPEQARGR